MDNPNITNIFKYTPYIDLKFYEEFKNEIPIFLLNLKEFSNLVGNDIFETFLAQTINKDDGKIDQTIDIMKFNLKRKK